HLDAQARVREQDRHGYLLARTRALTRRTRARARTSTARTVRARGRRWAGAPPARARRAPETKTRANISTLPTKPCCPGARAWATLGARAPCARAPSAVDVDERVHERAHDEPVLPGGEPVREPDGLRAHVHEPPPPHAARGDEQPDDAEQHQDPRPRRAH